METTIVKGSIVTDGCCEWKITRMGSKITTIKNLHKNCGGHSINVPTVDIGWVYDFVRKGD